MTTTSQLDADQQAAVDSFMPLRLLVCGPGSGKTRVLVAAVEQECRKHGTGSCVVLTYTNAAADEIRSRLEAQGVTGMGFCGTLHGFLLRVLNEWSSCQLSVIDDDQRDVMLLRCAEDLGVKASLKALVAAAESPLVATSKPSKPELVSMEYRQRLIASGLVDFSCILYQGRCAALAMQEAGRWPYKSLFVDEVQDSAMPDWCVYGSPLFERKFLVGDPDQGIYSFRGGRVDMLVKLAEQSANPKAPEPKYDLHLLETNYRSVPVICEVANNLIRQNKVRHPKITLPPDLARGGDALARGCDTPAEELSFVLYKLQEESPTCHYPLKECAVLARTNALASAFADYLAGNGVPVARCQVPQLPGDWARCKLLLSLLGNPYNDSLVLAYMMLEGQSKIAMQALHNDARAKMCSVNEAYGWRFGKGDGHVDDLCRFDLSTESRQRVHDGCRELGRSGAAWTLNDLVVYLTQQERLAVVRGEGVFCGTVHAAKGREWSLVFVVGMEEGSFPSRADAAEEASLEESRRLAYTAITRAKERLVCTWSAQRPQYRGPNVGPGPMEARQPSRFLKEAGLL